MQLRELLVAAPGVAADPFELAWAAAVDPPGAAVLTSTRDAPAGAIRWPSDTETRRVRRHAVMATRAAWHRAYERATPTRGDLALVELLPVLGGLKSAEMTAEFQVVA